MKIHRVIETDLLEKGQELIVRMICSIPETNPLCQEAREYLKTIDPYIYPEVRKAFELDAKRQLKINK